MFSKMKGLQIKFLGSGIETLHLPVNKAISFRQLGKNVIRSPATDQLEFITGEVTFFNLIDAVQDVMTINPNNVDIDFKVNADTATALEIQGEGNGKIGFFAASTIAQPSHIADPTGGGTVDAEARTAINSILADLATLGLQAAA